MTFSDFVENVVKTPICCELKQNFDKLYELYEKDKGDKYMKGIKNLEIVVTENDKMSYFEIKYKEEVTENYVNVYTGNDIFKGWIIAYYKLLKGE